MNLRLKNKMTSSIVCKRTRLALVSITDIYICLYEYDTVK